MERDIDFEGSVGSEGFLGRERGAEFTGRGAEAGGHAAVDDWVAGREPTVGGCPLVEEGCADGCFDKGEVIFLGAPDYACAGCGYVTGAAVYDKNVVIDRALQDVICSEKVAIRCDGCSGAAIAILWGVFHVEAGVDPVADSTSFCNNDGGEAFLDDAACDFARDLGGWWWGYRGHA